MDEPKLSEAIEFIAILKACDPAVDWLRKFSLDNPTATCSDLWSTLLELHKLHKEDKPPKDTHVGKSWLAWFARHVVCMPCSNGTFSGMPNVNNGPSADKLDRVEALNKFYTILSENGANK